MGVEGEGKRTLPAKLISIYLCYQRTTRSTLTLWSFFERRGITSIFLSFTSATHEGATSVATAQTRTRPKELRSEFSMLLVRELDFSTRSDSRGGPGRVGSELLRSFSYSSLLAER